ncbi:hypothetical protein Glove_86g204 [Diversispora epigaea]|uniref:Protein kinase domain-containing protein n=1 Tax=Diversispora epigaea TaxID=1348612 RepID=A0A397JGF8_9GLOM|nr:hypothetical protein Glove_86g204 [Diversispora epigaea]
MYQQQQQRRRTTHCPTGHSSNVAYNNELNYISFYSGNCNLCTKEQFIQELKTWSSGNVNLDKVIQEFQIKVGFKLQWIPYENFHDIKYLADGGYSTVYSAILKNGMKAYWNYNKKQWNYAYINSPIALKELKDSKYDISEFLKEIKNLMIGNDYYYNTVFYGISKNPSTQNYIIFMLLYEDNLHRFLVKKPLRWDSRIGLLRQIIEGLDNLHRKNLVHGNLHSGNILMENCESISARIADFGFNGLTKNLIKKSSDDNNKNINIYGLIPYIPPEVLQGNAFTKEGDIYSFGGIMYEITIRKRPFYERAHDSNLISDICFNGVRPQIPDMQDLMPKFYSDLIYRCWNANPSDRPTTKELSDIFKNIYYLFEGYIKDDNALGKFKTINDEKEIIHPQSCYISRNIYTLYGLQDSLKSIKSGKCADPNLLKFNE